MANMNITLPFEIEAEILKRVPEVKSLLQFRSVSKSWKDLIDSPRFIADYHQSQPPLRHISVWCYHNSLLRKNSYVSIIDNEDDDSHSFAQNKVPLSIPESINYFEIYGSSGGLFCLYKKFEKLPVAYLWNPSIRKLSVAIDLREVFDTPIKPIIGFGVSPYSSDPKLVMIQTVVDDLKPRRVEIYSLSTGEWRTLSPEVLPRSSVVFKRATFYGDNHHVAIGNFIFWLAEDVKYENTDGGPCRRKMIILFDMISEKFTKIYLPGHMTKDNHPYNRLSLFKIRESLAVVVSSFNHHIVYRRVHHVWMMEGGVSDSFTKMYSIITPHDAADFSLLAFGNNDHPIIRMDYGGEYELFVYEPDTEQFTPIAASRYRFTWYACSYMETLLLLDH